jgi:dTDP-4-dehydrorhamnose 3,5-epimerase-like enzyme
MDNLRVKNCYLIKLPKFGDKKRGFLSALEEKKDISFNIGRIYYIYGIGDLSKIRGPHAHRGTEQVFICLRGRAAFFLDDGKNKRKITIKEPNAGLYIGKRIWHSIKFFSKDTIVLGIASGYYNEKDYIRNYNKFMAYVN